MLNRLLKCGCVAVVFVVVGLCGLASADCIPIEQAKNKIGSNACVTGKVFKVEHTRTGTTFLDFCEDYKSCPFVVVVFSRDLRDVGDVRQLEGKTIEVGGKIEEYMGRAEIILKDVKQLRGEAASIPPLPKNYDATKRGNFSAGSISKGKSRKGEKPTLPNNSGQSGDLDE